MPDVSNPYYTEQFAGQAGQTARAEEVTAEFDGVQGGFDRVLIDVNRAIKAPTGETLTDLPAALTRANQWLRFDATGQPVAVPAPFNWRGLYVAGTLYLVGDVVQKATHQSLYYCTTQHTAPATFDASKWSVFVDLSGVPFFNYRLVNTAGTHALALADSVFVDSSAGSLVLNLPAGPVLGDSPINITHVGGTLATGQTIQVVAAAGTFIQGTSETTLNLDTVGASFSLSYAGAAYGWRARVMG